ncbi:MAG: winged helix family transcriptional regulator [Hyphomicrobiales bacterium]|nr:MAG: winged helix family transcriptional regulator [Hyphomicrobiales bacterium]
MKADQIVDLAFGRNLMSVTHSDGTQLHFTRQERTLLSRLVRNPGRLMRRAALAEAVSGLGEEPIGERHVDYLVNQLRRKLRDSARAPRLIRTQYGEGYIWIGTAAMPVDGEPVLLRFGPVYGEQLPGAAELIEGLTTALTARIEPGRFAAPGQPPGQSSFTLEASLHDSRGQLKGALVLRDGNTGAIQGTFRIADASDSAALGQTAEAIAHALWSSLALPAPPERMAPGEPPPWVRLFEAALTLDGQMLTWKSNAGRLDAILANEPDNAVAELMRGLNLYTWLIQNFRDPAAAIISEAQWQATEDEMESIALAALPRFADQPVMQLAAAKLLLFIDRGYLHLARRIADDLLESSAAHAAAFALAGEAAGLLGETARATVLLERALELTSVGTPFQFYLLTIEATALLAGNDRAGFDRLCTLTRAVAPHAYETLRAFCVLPGFEQSPVFAHIIAPDAGRAHEALRFLWNTTGRHFARRDHRRNMMRPLAAALVARFGPDVLPAAVDLGTGLRAELTA